MYQIGVATERPGAHLGWRQQAWKIGPQNPLSLVAPH